MSDQVNLLAARKAMNDRALAAAEKHFAKVLSAAIKAGKWGRFGITCSLNAGQISLMRVLWEEDIKPDAGPT